jgi:hypothetical protein
MAVRPNVPRTIRMAAGGIALSVLGAGISQAAEAPAQRKTTQSESSSGAGISLISARYD